MEWWLVLLIIFGVLFVLLVSGVPVFLAFILINVVGAFMLWGGGVGLRQLSLHIVDALASFVWLPIPLFIIMGEVMFRSGVAISAIDNIDSWLGRLPGRLGLLAVGAGTLMSTLTGSTTGSTVVLGNTLTPEMEKRGYKKPMSLGPILGSGGLAVMIPPSNFAIITAAIGKISVGAILIGGIIPGLMMAFFYSSYIIIRCWLQPSIAPPYDPIPTPLLKKITSFIKDVLPLGFIIFAVTGVILLGIATPSEAAATGALGTVILAAVRRRLSWGMMKSVAKSTITLTVMIFCIILGSIAFAQILSFSGGSRGLAEFVVNLPLAPILIIISMQVVLLFMGMFMGPIAIVMITMPIYMPLVQLLGFSPIWFGLLVLINLEMSQTTPPFGISLFAMKGVAPPDTKMGDLVRASLPFLGCDLIVMILIIAFPQIALWLPGLMRR